MRRITRQIFGLSLLLAAFVAPVSMAGAQSLADTLISESGQPVRLSDYRGKVVFVNFWGSWCTPCMAEMSSIRKLQEQLRDRGNEVAFVFVSAKSSYFQNDTAWLRQQGIAGANYRRDAGASQLYVPTTYILDRSGAVAQYRSSPVAWETHADMIRSLLTRRS